MTMQWMLRGRLLRHTTLTFPALLWGTEQGALPQGAQLLWSLLRALRPCWGRPHLRALVRDGRCRAGQDTGPGFCPLEDHCNWAGFLQEVPILGLVGPSPTPHICLLTGQFFVMMSPQEVLQGGSQRSIAPRTHPYSP